MSNPVCFNCMICEDENIKVDSYNDSGIILEMLSPSQTDMGEAGQIVLSRLDAENLAYTINQILGGK